MNAKRRTYHLEIAPGTSIQAPSDLEIEKAIRGLPGGVPSYVILTKKKNHFMQAAGGGDEGYNLEYMEFSLDGLWEHEKSAKGEVDLETVVKALVDYAGDTEYWRELPWKRLSAKESGARAEKAREKFLAELPQAGFFRTVISGLLGIALIELGIVKKKR
jgi:hypothetical protein